MSEKKDDDAPRQVFLSVFLVGDASYYKERAHIEEVLDQHFPGSYELDHEDPEGIQDREVVYAINFDWPDAIEHKQHFFSSLQAILGELSLYSTSFAQGTESFA